MAGSPDMAGGRQGQRHMMAEGLDESKEQNRDRWRCSVVVRACREQGTKRKKHGKKKKKNKGNKGGQHPAAPQGDGTEKDEWLGPHDGRR